MPTPTIAEAVRDVGVSWVAGPVRLAPGGSALARLWLPAGRPARPTFLGDGGHELGHVDVESPAGAEAFFEVVVEAAYDGNALRITDITDGTSNTLLFHERSQGIIAILIGLLSPAGPRGGAVMPRAPMATLQILRRRGAGVLPHAAVHRAGQRLTDGPWWNRPPPWSMIQSAARARPPIGGRPARGTMPPSTSRGADSPCRPACLP